MKQLTKLRHGQEISSEKLNEIIETLNSFLSIVSEYKDTSDSLKNEHNDISAKLVQFMGDSEHKISFDMVCKTMLETGRDLHEKYRETAEGGLAKEYRK